MPTITDRRLPLGGMLAALAVWFAGMSAGALVVQPATIVAFGPPDQLAAAVAGTDGSLVAATRTSVTLRPGRDGTVAQLYRAGAWLVWPSFDTGCISRSPDQSPDQSRSSTTSAPP